MNKIWKDRANLTHFLKRLRATWKSSPTAKQDIIIIQLTLMQKFISNPIRISVSSLTFVDNQPKRRTILNSNFLLSHNGQMYHSKSYYFPCLKNLKESLSMTLNCIQWWNSNSCALWSHLFIAITPRSTLSQISYTF